MWGNLWGTEHPGGVQQDSARHWWGVADLVRSLLRYVARAGLVKENEGEHMQCQSGIHKFPGFRTRGGINFWSCVWCIIILDMLGVINRVTPKKKVIGVYQRGRQHMVADGPNPNEQLPWLAAAIDEGSTIRLYVLCRTSKSCWVNVSIHILFCCQGTNLILFTLAQKSCFLVRLKSGIDRHRAFTHNISWMNHQTLGSTSFPWGVQHNTSKLQMSSWERGTHE